MRAPLHVLNLPFEKFYQHGSFVQCTELSIGLAFLFGTFLNHGKLMSFFEDAE